jgi:serine/threonine-protein kinase
MAVLQPGTKLKHGTFEVISLLGSGGFGEVYLARQARIERDVAIKVLRPQLDQNTDMVVRFQREAFAAASLMHPNVLTVFDFDYDEAAGAWFLAMQYVPGGRTLRSVIGPPLPLDETVRLVEGVASALDAAHSRGIVHRDVKPENVMLDGARVLLTDFGVAHLTSMGAMTAVGIAIGTPAYMSPEQALSQAIGPKSDQYSLAVMVYEMLAGRPPFLGEPVSQMLQHASTPPPSLTTFNPQIGSAARSAVMLALSKSPDDRFLTCTEFVDALRVAASSSWASIEGRSPPGPGYEHQPAPPVPQPTRKAPHLAAGAQPGERENPVSAPPPPANRTIARALRYE